MIHDQSRRQLFQQWLKPGRRNEFAAISARLVEFFTQRARAAQVDEKESFERRRMFHLIGLDQDSGVDEFERLWHPQLQPDLLKRSAIILQYFTFFSAAFLIQGRFPLQAMKIIPPDFCWFFSCCPPLPCWRHAGEGGCPSLLPANIARNVTGNAINQ